MKLRDVLAESITALIRAEGDVAFLMGRDEGEEEREAEATKARIARERLEMLLRQIPDDLEAADDDDGS